MSNAIERISNAFGCFFIEVFMNEKEEKRLKRIKESTEVNEQYIEQHKRISIERHKRSRQQVKAEIYENKNINYRKHMKW